MINPWKFGPIFGLTVGLFGMTFVRLMIYLIPTKAVTVFDTYTAMGSFFLTLAVISLIMRYT